MKTGELSAAILEFDIEKVQKLIKAYAYVDEGHKNLVSQDEHPELYTVLQIARHVQMDQLCHELVAAQSLEKFQFLRDTIDDLNITKTEIIDNLFDLYPNDPSKTLALLRRAVNLASQEDFLTKYIQTDPGSMYGGTDWGSISRVQNRIDQLQKDLGLDLVSLDSLANDLIGAREDEVRLSEVIDQVDDAILFSGYQKFDIQRRILQICASEQDKAKAITILDVALEHDDNEYPANSFAEFMWDQKERVSDYQLAIKAAKERNDSFINNPVRRTSTIEYTSRYTGKENPFVVFDKKKDDVIPSNTASELQAF